MKKLSHCTCFAVFMAFFTTFGVNAQIQIGTGTYITEKSPMNGYYNNGWSNIIYLASEIGKSGSLTSVSFYVNNSSANETMLNQAIYVRHTGATSYTSKLYEGPSPVTGDVFTQVFNGTVTYSGSGWKTITFNTPFNYNGLSNLEFLFENRNGSWVSTFPYFNYTSSLGANRMRYDYLDANFPSTASTNNNYTAGYPNIKLYITPCNFNSGTVSANASSVIPGNQITVTLSGQDAGSTIQWQSSTDNINFTTISGATSSSYTETANQTKHYRAMVTNGGCSKLSTTATVTADLSSMTTKTIGTGTTLSEKYPFNNYYDYSWSNMIYKASEIGTSGLLSRISFSVGTLPANLTANNQIIYVRHTTQNAYTTNTYPTTTGFTKVFEGTINYMATGWLEIVFDKQFYYNGTDNLEFLFENRDGSYTSSYPVFHSTLISEIRTRRDYQDGSFPTTCTYNCNRVTNLMNIQMKFLPCANGETASATNPTVFPFGSSTISVTGQRPLSTIQWQVSTDNTNFTDISGATNTSYNAVNIISTSYYKAQIKSPEGCTTTSNTVTVAVDESTLTTKSIGTGTSVFDKYPFNGYYDYSWATMLYKAAEINATGKLTKVSFYVENSPVNEVMNNQKIYVRHTSTSEYSDQTYPTKTGFTLVYDGTITYNGSGWKEITLQTQFDYNGVDDLEFLFENRDGSWTTTYPTFRGQAGMPENRVRRDFQDGSFPETCTANCNKFNNILNIQMKFLPCTIASGTIAATQTTVKPGENIEVTLNNQEAGATIQWEQSDDNYNFKVIASQTAATLAIPMTIKPLYIKAVSTTSCASHSNTVTITPDNCFMPVTSTGTGTSTTEKYPFDVYYNNSWSSTIYTQPEIGSAGTITSLSFKIANAPDNYVTHNQKIYVKETSANDYPTTDYPTTEGFTLVYDGSITYRGGSDWKEITLQTPFSYNGTSNLEFLFENRDGSYGYDYPTFEYTSGMSTYRTKRDYDDNGFPETCVNCGRNQNIPNVKFKFQGPANPVGTVVASETDICDGTTSELMISGQASGSTIQWQSSSNNADFTDIQGANSEIFDVQGITGVMYYRAKVTFGNCSAYSEVLTLTNNCKAKISVDNNTGLSAIEVDLVSVTDKVGPYHYFISETPIPTFNEIYQDLKTNAFDGNLDETQFYQQGIPVTKYTHTDLESGEYYIAVFDSRGVRILDKKVNTFTQISFPQLVGFTQKGNKLTANQNGSIASTDLYFTEETKGALEFELTHATKTNFVGLVATNIEASDISTIQYGFSVKSNQLYTIENGVETVDNVSLTSPMTLKLKQGDQGIEYYANGSLLKTANLLPETNYALKGAINLQQLGSVTLKPFGGKIKPLKYKVKTELNNCLGTMGVVHIRLYPVSFHGQTMSGFNVTLTNSTNAVMTQDGTSNSLNYDYSNLPAGVYNLTINYNIITNSGTVSAMPITQTIYVDSKVTWTNLNRTVYSSVNESILGSSVTSSLLGQARSNNEIGSSFQEYYVDFNVNDFFVNSSKLFRWMETESVINTSSLQDIRFVKTFFGSKTIYVGLNNCGSYSNLTRYRVTYNTVSGQIKLYKLINGVPILLGPSTPVTTTNNRKFIKMATNRNLAGFSNVTTNLHCNVPKIYAKLERTITGTNYKALQNKFYFFYDEEYTGTTTLTYAVKDASNHVVMPIGTSNSLNKEYGDNRYELDVTLLPSGSYILEVKNEKNETFYLRFTKP